MGLQRTPPQRIQPLPSPLTSTSQPVPQPPAGTSTAPQTQPQHENQQIDVLHVASGEGDKTTSSEVDKTTLSNMTPGRAFAPRRPGVMRTPPPRGDEEDDRPPMQEHIDERPIRPAPVSTVADMDVDLQPGPGEVSERKGLETEMEMEVDQTGISAQWANVVGMASERRDTGASASASAGVELQGEDEAEAEAEAAVEAEMLTEEPSMREEDMEAPATRMSSTAMDADIDHPTPAGGEPTLNHPTGSQLSRPPRQSLRPQSQSRKSTKPYSRPITPEPASAPALAPASASASASEAGPSTSTSTATTQIPMTPGAQIQSAVPKTPRSRSRRPTEPLPSPPKPLPVDEDEQDDYGRRYQLTMETLERAVKAGAQRWTLDHLKGCFPQLSKDNSKAMQNMCLSASQSMASNILNNALAHMEHYKVGAALKSIDAVDQEAREYARNNPSVFGSGKCERPDAWRADLEPQALVAATILPIYDEAYTKLREEYLELHAHCAEKYKTIREKQTLLKELEGGVADGVVDLQKTIEILDQLPVEDMALWTETVDTKLDTRAPGVTLP
ncbi:hypothetical protein IAT40_005987 [Kwoniella sp. CBS 6097]